MPSTRLKRLEAERRYRKTHREQIRKYAKHYALTHYKQIQERHRRWYLKNRKDISARARQRGWEMKIELLTHYGNGKLACVWCGFDNPVALTIDHINDDGERHRQVVSSGYPTYRWLRSHKFPVGYQTLCFNCQWIKQARKRWGQHD